jgi:hypothetical protein
LAAVEHSLDDMIGSITRQIEAVEATSGAVAAADRSAASTRNAGDHCRHGSTGSPSSPRRGSSDDAFGVIPDCRTGAPWPPTAYAVDVGSALSLPALRSPWELMRSAHTELFAGLEPVVKLRQRA